MKRVLSVVLTFVLLFCTTACGGNFAKVNLNEPIAIPENGVIEKSVFDKIKDDNAIATFTGVSGNIKYEWTVFGNDIDETRDINLSVYLEKNDKGIKIAFAETDDLGFPALLSLKLNEKWSADGATAYSNGKGVYSVSVTGSKTSILNISVNKIAGECEIIPDVETDVQDVDFSETNPAIESTKSSNEQNGNDNYLSNVKDERENTVVSSEETTEQTTAQSEVQQNIKDHYLSGAQNADDRIYSNGKDTQQDKYKTEPVPEGKPMPVEPENQQINSKKTYTCTFSIECSTILNNLSDLDPDKRELVPSSGVILPPTKTVFYEGESVYDVLQRVCKENNIHMESSWTPIYNSAYIEGINNLYEFDCGELSGWMYRVNGWYPNYGCSRYQLADGEVVEWRYTCDLGNDIGRDGSW